MKAIKKILQVVMAFGLLLAGYAGYVRVFALASARLAPAGGTPGLRAFAAESATLRQAIALAGKAFGRGHWTGDKGLQYRYYNDERGYWMYTKHVEQSKDGKQLTFTPFALIWRSRDGRELKTATSDEGVVDLDQPLGLSNKPNSPGVRVIHAKLQGDVRLRDDKGTPADPDDDLVVVVGGPISKVEYDEATLKITSDSDIVIQDREMRATGTGMRIDLRPKEEGGPTGGGSGGFNGAKTAFLFKNVVITLHDVGASGFLPGTSKPEQRQGGRTPLEVHARGPMRIDLPKPRDPVLVGPPAPPLPTLATFVRDVIVVRGKLGQPPDQINCDQLDLTLLPADKAPEAAGPGDPSTDPGGVAGARSRRPPSPGPLRTGRPEG